MVDMGFRTIQRFPLLPNDIIRYVDITSHVCIIVICVFCCTVRYLEVTTSTHFLPLKGKSFMVNGEFSTENSTITLPHGHETMVCVHLCART